MERMEPSKSTENLAPRSQSNNSVLLIVVVIALVVAAIALIIAIVSISQNGGKQNINISTSGGDGSSGDSSPQTGGGSGSGDDRIWQLSFEHTGNNYGYIDDTTGELRGFQIDLATAICQIAGKNCQLVYDSPPRCWESLPGARPQGGEGLMGQYYDACVGWVQSYDRPRTFKFSKAYSYPIKTVFIVKKGNPNGFVWTDLTGSKLGFISGWAYDEHCIAREKDRITGWGLAVEQIVRYPGRQELFDGLMAGEIDAAFDNAGGWIAGDTANVDVVSDELESCARDGLSVMMRKDNQLDTWWNPAFDKLRATSQWKTICNDLLDEHGHRGGPMPADFCVGYN